MTIDIHLYTFILFCLDIQFLENHLHKLCYVQIIAIMTNIIKRFARKKIDESKGYHARCSIFTVSITCYTVNPLNNIM